MTYRDARRITAKVKAKSEKEMQREIKSLIRTIKADIKKTAKKGISDFRVKVRDAKIYKEIRLYFISKGFRCWECTSFESDKYLVIEW